MDFYKSAYVLLFCPFYLFDPPPPTLTEFRLIRIVKQKEESYLFLPNVYIVSTSGMCAAFQFIQGYIYTQKASNNLFLLSVGFFLSFTMLLLLLS